MKVNLISNDVDMLNMCREILNNYEDLDWQLAISAPGSIASPADLYVWDGGSAVDGGAREIDRPTTKHLFLLHQSEIPKFQENLGSAVAAILLKPVTRACLGTFLQSAAESFRHRNSAALSLRSDRDEMLQCLIQTNLQLQQFEQDRTNFLTRAVHDFRAPLTATGGYCGLLLDGALGPLTEEQKEVLGRMRQSVNRLSRMASAMFELGVGRHLKRKPDLRQTDIRERVDQALHETNPLADSKNISISVDLIPEEGTAYLDAGLIERVLMNLLDNACKFTPKGGAIEIRGYPFFWERRVGRQSGPSVANRRHRDIRFPNSYRIDIRDSGPQIPAEHMGKIFEEYTSYVGSQDRSGGGLGLAICRMIIESHEGRVWAENTDYGPMFSFVLPVSNVKPTEQRLESAIQLVTSEAH